MENTTEERDDEEIVFRVQRGDGQAFGVFVERYEQRLMRYGKKFLSNREDIQDIVQDVFMNAYKNIQSFDISQKFSSWIYRIAHNAFVNALRKQSNNPLVFLDFDALVFHAGSGDTECGDASQEEIRVMIEKSLDAIAVKYKEVLILYYIEELPYKEIADVLRVPLGTVGVRLKRAKQELKRAYERLQKIYE